MIIQVLMNIYIIYVCEIIILYFLNNICILGIVYYFNKFLYYIKNEFLRTRPTKYKLGCCFACLVVENCTPAKAWPAGTHLAP